MSTTVTYQGDTIATLENETKTLLTQGKWAENNIIITDSTRGSIETETDPIFAASPAANITQTNINNWNNKSDFSGNYNDLTNKPNIPTKVSDLNNDSNFLTTETDPVFSASPAAGITSNNITSWNNKSDFSGNYNDLTNKPVLDTALSTSSTKAVENQAISIALEGKASKQYVDTTISNIPSPMIFKGSLGTNGTITSLPNASAINTGFTYKVIQAGIYASQTAEIGDIFISDGTNWILIPSGNDVSNVIVTPVQTSGTKIATITIDTSSTDLYAPTPVAPPNASTLAPSMDGTAAAGTSTSYARADHIHPVDTSRASANDVSNLTTRVGNLETAIGTGGSVDNKIATAIQGLDSSITATSGEAISAITITDGKITTSSKITIPTYTIATTAANGLMSSADKLKLDNCSTGSATALQYIKDGPSQSVLLGDVANNIASGLYSVAEGNATTASGDYSHAEGYLTLASTIFAHAQGNITTASGIAAHAEGGRTNATTYAAHAQGDNTTASGYAAHAEGMNSRASVKSAHAEGGGTRASGEKSHAEGSGTTASGDSSHAEGYNTLASIACAHAEGKQTTASAKNAHAEGESSIASGLDAHTQGYETTAVGQGAHAEGGETEAIGDYSHAEGKRTTASGSMAHAEGKRTTASGQAAHTEGQETQAVGDYSHAQGNYTVASGQSQHVFGEYNIIDSSTTDNTRGNYIEIVGNGETATTRSNARTLDWDGNEVLAGKLTVGAGPTAPMDVATKQYVDNNSGSGGSSLQYVADGTNDSVLLGDVNNNIASGLYSIAEGNQTTASGESAHAEGRATLASTAYSHAEGVGTIASGPWSHAEGDETIADSYSSHAEGCNSTASGSYSHAEGYGTLVSAQQAHAEGNLTTASGNYSHAEGNKTIASGLASHSQGLGTQATGRTAHAEGNYTTASGQYSHSGGNYTIATRDSQTVIGKYNKVTLNSNNSTVSTDAAFVIGNGTSAAPSDAFAVKWDGTLVFANGAELSPAQVTQLLALLNN